MSVKLEIRRFPVNSMKNRTTYRVIGKSERGQIVRSPWLNDYETALVIYEKIFGDLNSRKIIKRIETFMEVTP